MVELGRGQSSRIGPWSNWGVVEVVELGRGLEVVREKSGFLVPFCNTDCDLYSSRICWSATSLLAIFLRLRSTIGKRLTSGSSFGIDEQNKDALKIFLFSSRIRRLSILTKTTTLSRLRHSCHRASWVRSRTRPRLLLFSLRMTPLLVGRGKWQVFNVTSRNPHPPPLLSPVGKW